MQQVLLRCVLAAAAIAALTAFGTPSPSPAASGRHATVAFAAASLRVGAFAADCGKCEDASGGGGFGHSFQDPGALFACVPNCHVDWVAGICFDNHPGCGETHDEFLELQAVAETEDPEILGGFLRENADHVRFNRDRMALQAIGCGDRVVAQVPVKEELARGL